VKVEELLVLVQLLKLLNSNSIMIIKSLAISSFLVGNWTTKALKVIYLKKCLNSESNMR
jgi:hypothetical protein